MKRLWKHSIRWSIFIFILTFVLACLFSVASSSVLEGVAWGIGMIIVIVIVLIGIFFDMMGIAAAAAQEKPFHAMASEKISGSRHAIRIVRNADRFASFCNDVIGDIAGIISGTASAIVMFKLFQGDNTSLLYTVVLTIFTALVSGLTVGGKALGKSFAIHHSTAIILLAGKFFYILEQRFGIKVFKTMNNKGREGKRGKK